MDEFKERYMPENTTKTMEKEHVLRYTFALNYVAGKKVLDIACGSGFGTAILAETAKEITGIDISSSTIQYAKNKYSNANIHFFVGNAMNLNFLENESFEVIVSFETVEHLNDYRSFLKEAVRILKKNGVLIISTPNKKFTSPNSEKPTNPYHVIEFYHDNFHSLLKEFFPEVKLMGQDHQNNIKKLRSSLIKIVPRKIRQLFIPAKIRDSYNAGLIGTITDASPQSSRFLIAICKKNK